MATVNVLPTSFSALSSFETCPRKHYYLRITKEVADPPGEAAMWGDRVHKALEAYLRNGTPLPTTIKAYQALADKLANKFSDATLLVEQQLSVNKDLEPVGWWDKSGWFRGIIDVALVRGDTAYVFDWKTGKQKDDFAQLKMFAALMSVHYPQLKTIHSAFVWLQPKTITSETYDVLEARTFWENVNQRIIRLENALEDDKWPAKPSGLCQRYCPVGRARCEHCGI
jgi:hypothetical protein